MFDYEIHLGMVSPEYDFSLRMHSDASLRTMIETFSLTLAILHPQYLAP